MALLGRESDIQVARRLGISPAAVWRKRVQLGIRALTPKQHIQWTKDRRALLGTLSDQGLATRWGVKAETIARKRTALGIAPFVSTTPPRRTPALKGILRLPVNEIRKRYRVSTETIKRMRQELGIPNLKRWP